MRKPLISLIFILVATIAGFSQTPPFSLVPSPLEALSSSACAWGDADNDGDLDLVLCGDNGSGPFGQYYRNNNGIFEPAADTIPALLAGSLDWGDADADGDLDLLMTGMDAQGMPHSVILTNEDGNLVESGIVLPACGDGEAVWGDYDNDGDPDILMAGNFASGILRNDGNGLFTDIEAQFLGVQAASCTWVDFNNDGRLDATVAGDSGGGMYTLLYRNDGGTFSEVTTAGFMGLSAGDIAWADLDRDNDPDLVLSGMDLYADGHFLLYKNTGDGTFQLSDEYSFNLRYSSVDLGDFDNDGFIDIILMGKINGCGGTAMTLLYQNLGFMQFFETSTLIPGFRSGTVRWGDFNNDGFSDLAFTGMDGYEVPMSAIYKNNGGSGIFAVNTPPEMPAGLNATAEGSDLRLSWNRAADPETPPDGLSYNIYMGTGATTPDVFSPMADVLTGYRRIAALGNTSSDTGWVVTGLGAGDYWFSVQAVDNGFLGSAFAQPQMISFSPVGLGEPGTSTPLVWPNPCSDELFVGITAGEKPRVQIYNQTGQRIYEGLPGEKINTSKWHDGMYYLKIPGKPATPFIKTPK